MDKNSNFELRTFGLNRIENLHFENKMSKKIDIDAYKEMLINGDSWNLFDNTYRLLFGKKDIEKLEFWNKISFFNLIQRFMKTSNKRSSNDDFKDNVALSLKIIEEINETAYKIIYLGNSGRHFFGKAVQSNSSYKIERKTSTKIDHYIGVKYVMENPKNLNIYFSKHPSQYFSWLYIDDFKSIYAVKRFVCYLLYLCASKSFIPNPRY